MGYVNICYFGLNGGRDQSLQSNEQVGHAKVSTGKFFLQVFTGYSGTVPEQGSASHFAFKCNKCACCWRNT